MKELNNFQNKVRRYARRLHLSPEDVDDFVQTAVLKSLEWGFDPPMKWLAWHWFHHIKGHPAYTSERTRALKRAESIEEMPEFLEAPVQYSDGLNIHEQFFNILLRAPTLHSVRKFRKAAPLYSSEFHEMVEDLKPLKMDWLKV